MAALDAPLRVAVFASGGGTNFQALLDHQAEQELWRVALLVMNREAGAAGRARKAGVPVRIIPTRDRSDEEVGRETLGVLQEHDVDLVLLAGYLRRIPPEVVRSYRGRMLNIHPALLPDFGGPGMYGKRVHEAVLAADVNTSGATVHFVDEEYDDGAILGQWHVEVLPGDTPEELAARVLQVEHRLYPAAVDRLCAALLEGRTPERMKELRLDEPPPDAAGSVHRT
ncbi:MAG: phosphoribosylglycinamide formyltransferase [Longimicrobiales bacterium]|nr:phosphoribosylglycinamide formyltransferase [Longimicrobiales bacterium]